MEFRIYKTGRISPKQRADGTMATASQLEEQDLIEEKLCSHGAEEVLAG